MENVKDVYEFIIKEKRKRVVFRENLGEFKDDMEKLIDVVIEKEVNRKDRVEVISNNRGLIVNKVDLLDKIQNVKDILELVYLLEDSKERDLLVALVEQMYVDINKEFKVGIIHI